MTSGAWGSGIPSGEGTPTGESVTSERRTPGDAAPLRTGSARPLIALASALLTLLCVALAFVFGVANGLLILATIFVVVHAWALGFIRLRRR